MKNALDYAQETLKMYSDESVINPYNRKASAVIFESERIEWHKRYNEQKIITYLETILERLPYEISDV
jgi:hypothetical protein